MKKVSFCVLANQYSVSLEDELADFVTKDFEEVGIEANKKNNPEVFFNAYLRLAERMLETQKELETMLKSVKQLS